MRKFWYFCTLYACLHTGIECRATEGAANLGVDYAYLFLMTLSPDFAAANYTFENQDGTSVGVEIYRLPYHIDLNTTELSRLQLEISMAYQKATEFIPVPGFPDSNVDAEWTTYGAGIGLLYDHAITESVRFIPSLRFGLARMQNESTYNGSQADLIRDAFEGILFNWRTDASVLNIGLGLSYNWKLIDRESSIKANVYHVNVDSFNESNAANKFSESANLLAVNADMIVPTNFHISGERLDMVFMLGTNYFFGENRRTLGYSSSYQAGMGAELPVYFSNKKYGYMRFSGQLLWADNMRGWMLTVGYTPD